MFYDADNVRFDDVTEEDVQRARANGWLPARSHVTAARRLEEARRDCEKTKAALDEARAAHERAQWAVSRMENGANLTTKTKDRFFGDARVDLSAGGAVSRRLSDAAQRIGRDVVARRYVGDDGGRGVSRRRVSDMIRDPGELALGQFERLCDALGIHPEWAVYGEALVREKEKDRRNCWKHVRSYLEIECVLDDEGHRILEGVVLALLENGHGMFKARAHASAHIAVLYADELLAGLLGHDEYEDAGTTFLEDYVLGYGGDVLIEGFDPEAQDDDNAEEPPLSDVSPWMGEGDVPDFVRG